MTNSCNNAVVTLSNFNSSLLILHQWSKSWLILTGIVYGQSLN